MPTKYVATHESQGFRDRFWEKGQTVWVKDEEIESCLEIAAHFKPYKSEEEQEIEDIEQQENGEPTYRELVEQMKARGVPIPRGAKKAQLIKLLEEGQALA